MDGTPPIDHGTQKHVLIDRKTPLEIAQVPKELSQILNGAYGEIVQKLQVGGKVNIGDIPTRPAVYLCSREDMEKMDKLRGSKSLPAHHFIGAMYFTIPHAIFLPKEDLEKSITNGELSNLKSSVYEEMIHALTTQYDGVKQTIRTGFTKAYSVGNETATKIIAGRQPKEEFDYYDWSISYAGEHTKRDFSEDKGAVYKEDETYTENTTHLAKYLMIEDSDVVIGTGQFIGNPENSSIKITSSAKCGEYKSEYAKRTNNRDISADLLTGLFLGDGNLMDNIANSFYRVPSTPVKVAASALHFMTNAADRLAFQLSTTIRELKHPHTFVFSNAR